MSQNILFLLLLLPAAGFVVLGLFGKMIPWRISGIFGTLMIAGTFLASCSVAWYYFMVGGKILDAYSSIVPFQFTWLPLTQHLTIHIGFFIDPLSAMMLLVVTSVSLMVHIYSMAYMKGEERYSTFFAFLSLFTFSMLGLVISSNIFQIYIFWELVGVSSFLLIGFYYDRPSAVAAAKKAFVVTRFADLGFLVGILLLSYFSDTLDFQVLISRLTTGGSPYLAHAATAGFLGISALTWGLCLIFIGGAGKSAMFPLHIWLPDAMEGPTPVSALIHAATMVVAGVYLVARLFPVYALSCPAALDVVAYTGAFSALFAAVIACTQTDIKRVLAYSTMSQIGFMMFALGVSGYGGESGLGFTASLFHLFTHAFFKALLFLGAGVVIHAVHSNELSDMGGLRKNLPVTHIAFLLACLAISGIPPFAGFFSKETILMAAFQRNSLVYWVAIITSCLTAFYMFRLYFSIFWNKQHSHVHKSSHGEAPFLMIFSLLILAIGAVAAGWVPFGDFVSSDGMKLDLPVHIDFSILPVGLSIAGILFAMILYKNERELPGKISAGFGKIYQAANRKFYIDEIYQFITKKLIFQFIGRPAAWFDKNIVDGLMNTLATITQVFSFSTSGLQSGKLQPYAGYFLGGVFGLVALTLYIWLR